MNGHVTTVDKNKTISSYSGLNCNYQRPRPSESDFLRWPLTAHHVLQSVIVQRVVIRHYRASFCPDSVTGSLLRHFEFRDNSPRSHYFCTFSWPTATTPPHLHTERSKTLATPTWNKAHPITVLTCLAVLLSFMLRAIITGGPGSGKGTISRKIVGSFHLQHVSSGDLLRQHLKNDDPHLNSGQLVPDDRVEALVFSHLKEIKPGYKGWLLDGFPRTLKQAKTLIEKEKVDMMISLQVPDATIIERLSERWVHMPSGRIYNTSYNPPLKKGIDDITGEPLEQRKDDQPDVVKERLQLYHSNISPILQYFQDLGILFSYKGTESDSIWPHIQQDIEKWLQQSL